MIADLVEVARTRRERRRGLLGRDGLPLPKESMLHDAAMAPLCAAVGPCSAYIPWPCHSASPLVWKARLQLSTGQNQHQ